MLRPLGLRPAAAARGCAAARADRRAHPAGRAGGELLVPAPRGRLRVGGRALRGPATWWTWPAARGTAAPCWRGGRPPWSAWTPTPRRTSTPASSTRRPGVRFERDLVDRFSEPCDAVVFLQTIEHVEEPERVLDHFRSMLRPGGAIYVSTPNVLTLAPEGATKSDNPWHVREYRPEEFRALCDPAELLGLFHARKLRLHELALRAGWDARARAPRHHRPLLRLVHARDLGSRLRASAGPAGEGAGLRRRDPVRLPDPPELPEAARPRWPAWNAPGGPDRVARGADLRVDSHRPRVDPRPRGRRRGGGGGPGRRS